MTNKEAKAVIFKWLKDRDFTRIKIPGNSGAFDYIHSLGEFNVLISFFKNRFDDNFFFQVGCYFDNCEYGYATIRVKDLKSNPHKIKGNHSLGLYYGEGELTEEQLIQCLNEMFDKYLRPYYVQGKKYLKEIVLKEDTLFGEGYFIAKGAREEINKMFGLHTTPD